MASRFLHGRAKITRSKVLDLGGNLLAKPTESTTWRFGSLAAIGSAVQSVAASKTRNQPSGQGSVVSHSSGHSSAAWQQTKPVGRQAGFNVRFHDCMELTSRACRELVSGLSSLVGLLCTVTQGVAAQITGDGSSEPGMGHSPQLGWWIGEGQ
jgi:hypothetical protein